MKPAAHRRSALLHREFKSETEIKVIFSSIEANQTSETAGNPQATLRRPTAVIFPHKFLEVTSTAVEKS